MNIANITYDIGERVSDENHLLFHPVVYLTYNCLW